MKALNEYFLMVVFTLLLDSLFMFFQKKCQLLCLIWKEKHGSERVNKEQLLFVWKPFPYQQNSFLSHIN